MRRRTSISTRRALVVAVAALGLVGADVARADSEENLATRYAPVVRLVEQGEACGPGAPYRPSDIDAFLDEETVSLRGPWRSNDLVEVRRRRRTSAAGSTSTTSTSPAMRSGPAAPTSAGRGA
jgi:hypothetical protein